MSEGQFVDEAVSRRKFDREVAQYRALESTYRKRGWFLLEATFPTVLVLFAALKVPPKPLVCAARLDFTNYDLVPPSVTFVDPATSEALPMKSLGFHLMRLIGFEGASDETIAELLKQQQSLPVQPLLQSHGPDEIPFLCLPGVREYHNHPAHTGDSWLLHRPFGEGSLNFILEHIWASGIKPIQTMSYQIQQMSFQGFQLNAAALPR
ncbi:MULTISPECIES: putative metal-binding protein [unclassified Ensifer]|uniref:putative metal-binding protein n=1 Tax=unclassified Ensifer TaxID=2633371 RepID=UPI001FF04D06|nr:MULTISPECIES: putative metal-binding protein [unclassified Ensifer]